MDIFARRVINHIMLMVALMAIMQLSQDLQVEYDSTINQELLP